MRIKEFLNYLRDLFYHKPKPIVEDNYYNIPKREIMKYITVHCSATPEGRRVTVEDLRKWHVIGNGWSDIGYHWFIDLDGKLHKCRPENKTGAHVKNFNKDNLGVCYAGGCDENMKPKDTRTEAQKEALVKFLKEKKKQYPEAIIQGHRDFPNVSKACPSFDAKNEYKNL